LITGVSYGGLSAYFIAALRSDVFHNLAAFSPSLWVLDSPQYLTNPEHAEGSKQMLPAVNGEATACGGDTGFKCPRLPIKIFLTVGLEGWDVGDFGDLVSMMKQQDYPVEFHQVREGHTWDHWRGLSDEMLNYFFGIR
jgi:enterochelin esterase-like enzyme